MFKPEVDVVPIREVKKKKKKKKKKREAWLLNKLNAFLVLFPTHSGKTKSGYWLSETRSTNL
jgi:hypothetical protein